MRELDIQVLAATDALSYPQSDIAVLSMGQRLFGATWLGGDVMCGRRYDYAPVVAMSLGRLARSAFVERRRREDETYSEWGSTEAGRAILQEVGILA